MVHKSSKMLSWMDKEMGVDEGVLVIVSVGVSVEGKAVKVRVGFGVREGWMVNVGFKGRFLATELSYGVDVTVG
jgi:hypothetical protein